jgi:hypothetical protein
LNVQVGEYWTATQFADDKEQGAVFTMHFGESGSVDAVNALALDEPLHFWCVRGSGPISEY